MVCQNFSARQLQSLKKACRTTAKTHLEIKKLIRPGLSEKEVAWQIGRLMKRLGAESLAFRPIVAAGRHSAEPHHKNTTRRLGKNEIVLLDFGCKVNGFCSDFSRTIFLGRPKPEWQKIYQIVKKSQKITFNHLHLSPHREWSKLDTSGIMASSLDSIARGFITKKGYGKNFIHGLGHGIGTKAHQCFHIGPKSKTVIKPGSVFTIEPGIYFRGRFGVRIEDVVWLSPKGLKILTKLVS